jgi:hypothetical protein
MSIGHFPSPYPDEMLYSICARFGSRVAYPDAKSILQELFDSPTATVIIDLPNRLRKLAAGLPAGTSLTTNCLIDQHTLLPFYSAFIPPERVKQIRKNMGGSSGPAAHMSAGVMASRIPTLDFMRYCSVCIKEDEKKFREAFWHRLHQLPGVEVCPSHQVFLENSTVGFRQGRKLTQFIPAEQATRATPVRHVDIENRDHRALLQLARDAEWLLEHPSPGTNLKSLYTHYLPMLVERGLAIYTGSIHVKKLLNEFSSYHSSELLGRLNCELRGSNIEKSNWLLRLVRASKHAQHPLYHLLLTQFLGCTIEEFFQLRRELAPFGEGPWPCLNPAAVHYRQPVIMECELGDRLRYGKPTGKFSCECGFAYARTGPDSSPEDRFRIGRIISFGQTWEDMLKRLWQVPLLSISEIGRRLGVNQLTIRRHAARLKLPLSSSDKRLKPLARATQLKGNAVSVAREKKRSGYRSKWVSAMKPGREITLKALRRKLPREYTWLRQNDSEWLEGHKPRPRRRNQPTAGVDWKRRDAEYAAAVRAAASRLKEAPGRPVQVTRTAIGRALGAITLLRQKVHKMPLTAQILKDVVETREQYAARRVWWAADVYFREQVLPREWQLMTRANVYSLRDNSAVECAVKGAMSMLTSKLQQSELRRAAS